MDWRKIKALEDVVTQEKHDGMLGQYRPTRIYGKRNCNLGAVVKDHVIRKYPEFAAYLDDIADVLSSSVNCLTCKMC